MLFDEETRYWQEEYRKGNLDDEDMCGETLALLDGSAEKYLKIAVVLVLLSIAAGALIHTIISWVAHN